MLGCDGFSDGETGRWPKHSGDMYLSPGEENVKLHGKEGTFAAFALPSSNHVLLLLDHAVELMLRKGIWGYSCTGCSLSADKLGVEGVSTGIEASPPTFEIQERKLLSAT